jgi:hypothetical protein
MLPDALLPKEGSDRPLLPVEGSFPKLPDHLVGIYSAEELASLDEDQRRSAGAVQSRGRGGCGEAAQDPLPSHYPGRGGGGLSQRRHSGRRVRRASDRA